jgi:hypothetical protein
MDLGAGPLKVLGPGLPASLEDSHNISGGMWRLVYVAGEAVHAPPPEM